MRSQHDVLKANQDRTAKDQCVAAVLANNKEQEKQLRCGRRTSQDNDAGPQAVMMEVLRSSPGKRYQGKKGQQ